MTIPQGPFSCVHSHVRPTLLATVLVVGLTMLGVACGADANTSLSPLAQEGDQVLRSNGCVGCHGRDGAGEGGMAPTWIGLPGSEIELDDGTFVVADEAYLRRAITDPSVEIHVGGRSVMPENDLDDEIDAVLAFIEEIQPADSDSGG